MLHSEGFEQQKNINIHIFFDFEICYWKINFIQKLSFV